MLGNAPKLDDLQSRAVEAVSGQRLWERLMTMARIGATEKGGVNRQAFTPEDAEARRVFADWGRKLGFSVFQDQVGNVFIRRPGTDPAAAPVVVGSHLDSQPTGGRFDGAYGVLAAFEALEAIHDAGITTRRPIEAVAWMNEEGSRYEAVCMGSGVYSGRLDLGAVRELVDGDGIVLGDILARNLEALGEAAGRSFREPIAAYLEAHIEQGPMLEAADKAIGVVTGIQGMRWFRVEVEGAEAHAGTTPLRMRKDALRTALEINQALSVLFSDEADVVRFTVGRFEVYPGSPNTVPGRVTFTIDFRHPDPEVLGRLGDQVTQICERHAGRCGVRVVETGRLEPVAFPQAMVDLVRSSALALDLSYLELPSGAGHDASHMADLCPTGMIFIPCLHGISHNEGEFASSDHCHAGAMVLAVGLVALANSHTACPPDG